LSNDLRAKVRSGVLWSAVQNWGVRLSSLLLFMVVARWLSPEQLGLFAAATVVIAFLNLLSEQGLGEALVQREEITQEQINSVFWLNLGASLLIVGLLWFVAPLIAALMKLPELVPILRVVSLSMPLTAASFGQLAMRRRRFEYRWLAKTVLASTMVSSMVALAMLFAGLGVWSLVAQSLTTAAVISALLWIRPSWHLTMKTDFAATRPLMAYGAKRVSTSLLDFANTRYIELFLASTLGPASLGLYTVGVRVYQALMQVFSSTILEVAQNGFCRLSADRPGLIRAYFQSIAATAAIVMPVFILIAAVAPSLTVTLFGARWVASAEVTRWVAMLGAVQVLQVYNGTVYNAIGRPGVGLQFMIFKVMLTFSALFLARDAGLQVLLQAYVASQLATTPLSFWLVRRLIGVSLTQLFGTLWPYVLSSAFMALVALGVASLLEARGAPAPLVLLGACAAAVSVYLLCLQFFAPAALQTGLRFLRPGRQPTAAA